MLFHFPFSKKLDNKKINRGLRKPLSGVELRQLRWSFLGIFISIEVCFRFFKTTENQL